jgi:ParB/RepB/Spo0J family partition protein
VHRDADRAASVEPALRHSLAPDITIVVRMDSANRAPFDYYLFPRIDMLSEKLRLGEENALALDAYRFDGLELLYDIATPVPLGEAADACRSTEPDRNDPHLPDHGSEPRARNKRQHREIVNNIEAIGLKRPITVSRRDGAGGPRYDLVCGEGRLEAFQMLGQTEIPAVVIEASESECLVMSLVENIARRTPRPIDLMKEIGALRSRGYTDAEIAEKIGVGASWVNMIASLLERGEERLVAAVETGLIPITWRWRFPRPRRKRRRTCSSTPMRPASSGARSWPPYAACSTCGCGASARVDCLSGGWAERAPASAG